MSSPIVIQVNNLGKQYRVLQCNNHDDKYLKYVLNNGAKNLARKIFQPKKYKQSKKKQEMFWALEDINFTIKQGESVGIIGRNGAGKSTLLKLLSRITDPTVGRICLRGTVASLLEVGTGFHPELTGKENVFLNGAILGMSRFEIKRKFDEIVSFAEVEKFLNLPVKRYSSGMKVRLAFAVAAHLDPDILLLDEVLAVGDFAFQKKCLSKMNEVTNQGRTLFFVSHNMGVMREFVNRGILLDNGRILYDGDINEAINKYLSSGLALKDLVVDVSKHSSRPAHMRPIIQKVACKKADNGYSQDFSQSEDVIIEIYYKAPSNLSLSGLEFRITTVTGVKVGSFNTYMSQQPPHLLPPEGHVNFTLPARQLAPGTYLLSVVIGSHPTRYDDIVENCISFRIHPADIYGTGYLLNDTSGVISLSARSTVVPEKEGELEAHLN